ncbi:MAG TPA: ester cyclase [Roseiflexaceae bacterium]|nr:ester cyclase [Roseiflexaceae bacterium]
MSTEHNTTSVRRGFEEGINQRKLAVFDELLAPNYVNHSMPAPMPGPEGLKAVIGIFLTGFPDFQVIVEQSVAEGDYVCTRGYFTGTHTGDFQGIPATGKSIRATYIDMWRFEAGKAVENWAQLDMLGLMQQLGVIPAPQVA